MLFNVKVNNSMLSGAIEAIQIDRDPRKLEVVLEEIIKATFLCPATVSIPPKVDEDGDLYLPEDCEVSHNMVRDKQGRLLLLAFTSQEEMDKWMQTRDIKDFVYGFGMNFTEYADMMIQKLPDGTRGPAEGFVIDPYGCNMVVDRDMVANIFVRLMNRNDKILQAQARANAMAAREARLRKETEQSGNAAEDQKPQTPTTERNVNEWAKTDDAEDQNE